MSKYDELVAMTNHAYAIYPEKMRIKNDTSKPAGEARTKRTKGKHMGTSEKLSRSKESATEQNNRDVR